VPCSRLTYRSSLSPERSSRLFAGTFFLLMRGMRSVPAAIGSVPEEFCVR
jgi:hypothetical protein